MGTWDTMTNGAEKALQLNSWPKPMNWVTDVQVLVCNQDTWIAQIKLAFAVGANFFWSSFLPSPREIERKIITGGYRCGFYLKVRVKSPISIIFGQGTSTVIAEIQGPFARGLFYWWAQETALGALSAWTTLMYPELFCEEHIGDGLRRSDIGSLGQGFNSGVPGLGVKVFDVYDFLSPTNAIVFLPPGYWKVYAAYFVNSSPWPTEGLRLGLGLDGEPFRTQEVDNSDSSIPRTHITQETGFFDQGHALSAWIEGTRPLGAFPQTINCVMFTYSWSPIPFEDSGNGLPLPNTPAGPRIPPKCGESTW